jgi:hypothetical protein
MLTLLAAGLLCQALDKEYVPIKQGTKWVYKADAKELTTEVTGSVTLSGKECAIATSATAGEALNLLAAYRIGDEGLLKCGATYKITELGPWIERNPPEMELKFGTKKGDRWEHKSGFRTATYEHAGEEELTVAAGTYKAIKISLVETWENDKTGTKVKTSRWYARGVGLIKQESTAARTAPLKELKSFTEGK